MRGLTDKNAIVTGGGGAIGRAISLRLGDEGCAVGIFDINATAAAESAERVVCVGWRGAGIHGGCHGLCRGRDGG